MDFSKSSRSKKDKNDASKAAQSKDREAQEDDYMYAPVLNIPAPSLGQSHQLDRTMFVVDLSRLKAERDTLENALIMYRPEREFKKPQYEQRCSQLVGISLCTLNLTGKYPEFLRLRGTGYAIRGLGEHYLMGLSSRMEEPSTYCVNYLKLIHSCFQFYYNSPAAVLKSVKNVWVDFAKAMAEIFKRIIHYILRDQHSVPAMLNPIPYISADSSNRNFARTYLLASRILKACQHHSSIAGGCVFFNEKVVISQFPPDITEKLLMIGGGAISLSKKNILGDNIAPGKVWVLEVYLTPEDHSLVTDCCKDHTKFKQAYNGMDRSQHLTLSTIDRLQSSSDSQSRPENMWKSRANSRQEFSSTETLVPGSTSAPAPKPLSFASVSNKPKASTSRSEDAIVLSPGLSSVFFDANDGTAKNRNSSSSSNKQDGDEAEYVDAVETMDTGTGSPNKPIPKPHADSIYEDANSVVRPASVSSEVFQTPSPSPPKEDCSSKSDRDSSAAAATNPADLSNEELAKLINAPMSFESADSEAKLTRVSKEDWSFKKKKTTRWSSDDEDDDFVDSEALQEMLSQQKKRSMTGTSSAPTKQSRPNSYAEDNSEDFVDSSVLNEMVEEALRESRENSISTGPPLPPRNKSMGSRPHPQEDMPPPLPPRNKSLDRSKNPAETKEDSAQSFAAPQVSKRASIYDTMERGATLGRVSEASEDVKSEVMSAISSDSHENDDDQATPIPTHDILEPVVKETSDETALGGIYSDDLDSIQPAGSGGVDGNGPEVSLATGSEAPSLFQSAADYQSSYEVISDVPPGMRTPPSAPSFGPESLMQGLPHRLNARLRKLRAPTLPPRKQKRPAKKASRGSGSENTDSDLSSDSDEDISIEGRPFLPTTIKRPLSANDSPEILKRCLYVQQYMGTEVVLLGSDNLHNNHVALNALWRSLLLQLHELDSNLRKDTQSDGQEASQPKPAATAVTYSTIDRRCEANPQTTAYHFRHAMRRIHQEYSRDPSLLQCSVSKEHLRMLSQSVHKREVYIQPSRLGHLDVLAMHGAVEKYAKTKTSLRQQPTGGPKIMIL